VSVTATIGNAARFTLGGVRVIVGTMGLLAPAMIINRFGDSNPAGNTAAVYGLRLFGVRTVVIGADLLRRHGPVLDRALKVAPLIHATDTVTVLSLVRTKQLSPERARPLLLISGLNTALALTAQLSLRRGRR
jgi:hypothetical protein